MLSHLLTEKIRLIGGNMTFQHFRMRKDLYLASIVSIGSENVNNNFISTCSFGFLTHLTTELADLGKTAIS